MKRQPTANLCPELDAILRAELRAGNQLGEGPVRTDWPQPGSIYAALRNNLKTRKPGVTGPVRHSICHDPHYGWNDECYCELHGDLLVAGSTQRPQGS